MFEKFEGRYATSFVTISKGRRRVMLVSKGASERFRAMYPGVVRVDLYFDSESRSIGIKPAPAGHYALCNNGRTSCYQIGITSFATEYEIGPTECKRIPLVWSETDGMFVAQLTSKK